MLTSFLYHCCDSIDDSLWLSEVKRLFIRHVDQRLIGSYVLGKMAPFRQYWKHHELCVLFRIFDGQS